MKRFVLGLVLLLSLSACSEAETSKTLKVFNWGVYLDETLIDEFEAEYGVEVIYDTFDSNETMYTKLASGEVYDVLYPSDYMVDRLIEEGLLQKLESETKAVLESYLPYVLAQEYDPENEYSIPCFWGNVGILYDTSIVDEQDVEKGWSVFKNPKYAGQVYFYDSERDAFMVALKALGFSTNTEIDTELNQAYTWLIEFNQNMKAVYVTDDVIDNMIAGNKALAVVYSGDAARILNENEDMAYFVPNEGSNVWIDSMVIPSNAQNPELANAWIRFMSSTDAMERNTLEVGYTTVRQDVYTTMIEGDYEGNLAYDVRMDNPNDEVYAYNEILKQKLSDLWIKVKVQ